MPIDPHSLPEDPQILQKIVVDLAAQLDQTQRLLQQLLTAKSGTRSEKLNADQLRLFAQELGIELAPKRRRTGKTILLTNRQRPAAVVAKRSHAGGAGYPRT